jgi:hypothetical protein
MRQVSRLPLPTARADETNLTVTGVSRAPRAELALVTA